MIAKPPSLVAVHVLQRSGKITTLKRGAPVSPCGATTQTEDKAMTPRQ